jgi:hypothetical protein
MRATAEGAGGCVGYARGLVIRGGIPWSYAARDRGWSRHGTEAAMDDNRFDGMAKRLGASSARRGALGVLTA